MSLPHTARPHTVVEGDDAFGYDLDRPGSTLICVFGGMNQGVGMPGFEFKRVTAQVEAKMAFFKDPSQAWYHGELAGIGAGHAALASHVAALRDRVRPERLVCMGNSMGGYAALAVGSAVGADRVVAFSPQTFISLPLRLRYRDRRWHRRIAVARRAPGVDRAAFDLARHLAEPGWGRATVYASRDLRLDRAHARRLEELPRTEVVWRLGDHNVVRPMRDSGELLTLLNDLTRG